MVGVKFQEGEYIPAAAPQIRQDKSVRCSIGVTNTGNETIPVNAAYLLLFYAPTLSSKTEDCQADRKTWSDEVDTRGGVKDYSVNVRAIDPGTSFTYIFSVSATYIPLGWTDAGFVLALDTDRDRVMDTYPDCILVENAFEIVKPPWAASLGTPTFHRL